ncbi:hypothetical protein CMV_001319 [Castanea mollissima]|uniref:Uncharacterized protein n=1 Tax=Castanea mollissima TaxID=60419 RepID=A0A8J4RX98_9ROSI|nr:hypothetical protein CMV_001319 [Castanea mollissima]
MDERKTCYRGFSSVTFADEISARNASKKQCYCWQWPNRHLCGLSSIKGKSLRSSLYRVVWATVCRIWFQRNSRIHG